MWREVFQAMQPTTSPGLTPRRTSAWASFSARVRTWPQVVRVTGPSAERLTTARPAWYFAAWSMIDDTRSGQSCISPNMGRPPCKSLCPALNLSAETAL